MKAAIGQEISHDELGGARVHSAISGTIDYHEKDDDTCLARLRRLIGLLPPDPIPPVAAADDRAAGPARRGSLQPGALRPIGPVRRARPARGDPRRRPARRVSGRVRPDARLRLRTARRKSRSGSSRASGCGSAPRAAGPIQFGGVIYADSADKAARFVLECNQTRVPILFIQDVNGFDVGRDAERTGIIRRGAKLVERREQQQGAQDHADRRPLVRRGPLCALRQGVRSPVHLRLARCPIRRDGRPAGRANDARRERGRAQARARKRSTTAEQEAMAEELRERYDRETDIRYAAARLWIDAIIDPAQTREVLSLALDVAVRQRELEPITTACFRCDLRAPSDSELTCRPGQLHHIYEIQHFDIYP